VAAGTSPSSFNAAAGVGVLLPLPPPLSSLYTPARGILKHYLFAPYVMVAMGDARAKAHSGSDVNNSNGVNKTCCATTVASQPSIFSQRSKQRQLARGGVLPSQRRSTAGAEQQQ